MRDKAVWMRRFWGTDSWNGRQSIEYASREPIVLPTLPPRGRTVAKMRELETARSFLTGWVLTLLCVRLLPPLPGLGCDGAAGGEDVLAVADGHGGGFPAAGVHGAEQVDALGQQILQLADAGGVGGIAVRVDAGLEQALLKDARNSARRHLQRPAERHCRFQSITGMSRH